MLKLTDLFPAQTAVHLFPRVCQKLSPMPSGFPRNELSLFFFPKGFFQQKSSEHQDFASSCNWMARLDSLDYLPFFARGERVNEQTPTYLRQFMSTPFHSIRGLPLPPLFPLTLVPDATRSPNLSFLSFNLPSPPGIHGSDCPACCISRGSLCLITHSKCNTGFF